MKTHRLGAGQPDNLKDLDILMNMLKMQCERYITHTLTKNSTKKESEENFIKSEDISKKFKKRKFDLMERSLLQPLVMKKLTIAHVQDTAVNYILRTRIVLQTVTLKTLNSNLLIL